MNDIVSGLTLRTIFIFASTAFSLAVVMLALNIVTVEEIIAIFHLEGDSANAFRAIVMRVQEVTGNILEIISQLLNKMLSWAGVDVDLNKIKVDVNQGGSPAIGVAPSAPAHGGVAPTHAPLNPGVLEK